MIKYDLETGVVSYVGDECHALFDCNGDGVLARDGHIYAAKGNRGEVLKINTRNNTYSIVGNTVESNHCYGWGDGIMGIDGCVYWPPCYATFTLKYDPYTDRSSLVGNVFGHGGSKWVGGALASDDVIYCIPYSGFSQVLTIDPFREFRKTLASNMEQYPERLGLLFDLNDRDSTHYEEAETKYGKEKVFEIVTAILPPANEAFAGNGLYPFMVAASYPQSEISVIYHLLRQVPSMMNS
jgi:hypothetical protein